MLASQLYEVTPHDPVIIAAVTLFLGLVALFATRLAGEPNHAYGGIAL